MDLAVLGISVFSASRRFYVLRLASDFVVYISPRAFCPVLQYTRHLL